MVCTTQFQLQFPLSRKPSLLCLHHLALPGWCLCPTLSFPDLGIAEGQPPALHSTVWVQRGHEHELLMRTLHRSPIFHCASKYINLTSCLCPGWCLCQEYPFRNLTCLTSSHRQHGLLLKTFPGPQEQPFLPVLGSPDPWSPSPDHGGWNETMNFELTLLCTVICRGPWQGRLLSTRCLFHTGTPRQDLHLKLVQDLGGRRQGAGGVPPHCRLPRGH